MIISALAFSQNKHMTFKGIPMEGTLNNFVQKLKAKGFLYKGTTDGVALLTGEFATMKGCAIFVNRFSEKDQVNAVIVAFPEAKTWNEITTDYYHLAELLTEKYGEPVTEERFLNYEPSDPYLKFHTILNDECIFTKEFNVENGRIILTMKKVTFNSASVILKYFDDVNSDQIRKKMLEDL